MANFVGTVILHLDADGDPVPIYSGFSEFTPEPPPGLNAALGERNDPRVSPDMPRREP
jgi:hypothetical protein